ncbi:MAG: universal stress protein [Dehalococcoidales bacterium]|nr:universal stress protein [Dehalococcoidales bacterium]
MYNKILVPLDGSKLGEAVVPFVNEIISGAKESRKIEIKLLQVVPSERDEIIQGVGSYVHIPYTREEMEQIKRSAVAYLDKVGGELKKSPNVTVTSLVKFGNDPAGEILKASDELNIDLVTISTHGRSGISRWAFGSVADKILRGGKTPVFMVRAAQQES